ncbi:MAG: glycosyltransferase family 39 protein [Anaerolineae bacterium]|nr:glycosyltransferase family 39 protein [Anaerolineae bacterium]
MKSTAITRRIPVVVRRTANRIRRLTIFEIGLGIILLLALVLRAYRPGLYELGHDESLLQVAAVKLARHGQWTWIGNPTSLNKWLFHSPLSVYVTALPYLFSANVTVTRLLYALLGTLTVGGTYQIVARYYDRRAALLAAGLLAVNPLAIYWSRFAWNPNIAPPCIVFWMLTGLLGYYEGKRWAQVVHWLMLSGLIQAQTALVMMLPVSVGLLVYQWWRAPDQRRATLHTTLLAFAVTALSVGPWITGLIGVQMDRIHPAEFHDLGLSVSQSSWPSVQAVWQNVALLTGSAGYHFGTLKLTHPHADWWPDARLNWVLKTQAILIIVSAVFLVWRGVRHPARRFPDLFVALVLFWPLWYVMYAESYLPDFYMMPSVFATAVIFGIVFGQVWDRPRIAGLVVKIAAVIFIAAQAWLAVALLDLNQRSDQLFPLADLQAVVRNWANAGGEVVILDEPGRATANEQRRWLRRWEILSEQFPIRIVRAPRAFPVAAAGSTLVSVAEGDIIPALFGPGDITTTPQRDFRWLVITPDDLPVPNYRPTGPDHYGDLARIQGIYAASSPPPGESWALLIRWQPLRSPGEFYQFSVRLLDDAGTTYGQVDQSSLDPALWWAGDTVLSRFDLPVNDALPDAATLHIDLLFYSWPEIANVPVVDHAGTPVSHIMTLAPAAASTR